MKKQSFVIILLSLLLIGKYAVWADEKPNKAETIEQNNDEDSTSTDNFTKEFREKNKPLFNDENLEVYLLKSKMNLNFINGKYTPYKIYFLNRSNSRLETKFVIYNLIP